MRDASSSSRPLVDNTNSSLQSTQIRNSNHQRARSHSPTALPEKRARLSSSRCTSRDPGQSIEEQLPEGGHAEDHDLTRGDEPLQDLPNDTDRSEDPVVLPHTQSPDADPHPESGDGTVGTGSRDDAQDGTYDYDEDSDLQQEEPENTRYRGPDVQPDDHPGGPNDWSPDNIVPHLEALRISVDFIKYLRCATLDDDPIPADVRERLRSPITEPLNIDNDLRLCLEVFLATTTGSEASYRDVCAAFRRHSPGVETLSYEQMKSKIAELTGVIPVMTDMCTNSCIAFTGPFARLRVCPECSSPRYETILQRKRLVSVSRKQACTIPVGPQIQAQYWSSEGARNMSHRCQAMDTLVGKLHANGTIDTYDDVYSSSILLNAAMQGD